MKIKKKLLFELCIFVAALVLSAVQAPGASIAITLMFFTLGVIILQLLDWASGFIFPIELESKYDYKTAYEDQVQELKGAGDEVLEKVQIVDFKRYKKWE